jgi:hypothetical protein
MLTESEIAQRTRGELHNEKGTNLEVVIVEPPALQTGPAQLRSHRTSTERFPRELQA